MKAALNGNQEIGAPGMGDIKNYQMLIDGDWVDASDGGMFDSVNPSTGEVWSRVSTMSPR